MTFAGKELLDFLWHVLFPFGSSLDITGFHSLTIEDVATMVFKLFEDVELLFNFEVRLPSLIDHSFRLYISCIFDFFLIHLQTILGILGNNLQAKRGNNVKLALGRYCALD